MTMPKHFIHRAWEQYADFTYRQNGCPIGPTDKLHWLCGFSTALSVITGARDVGVPEGTTSHDLIQHLVFGELADFRDELELMINNAKERGLK